MHPGQPLLRLKQSHNPHNHLVNFNDEGLLVCVLEICYEVELFSVGQLSQSDYLALQFYYLEVNPMLRLLTKCKPDLKNWEIHQYASTSLNYKSYCN